MFVKLSGVSIRSVMGSVAANPRSISELFPNMDSKELKRLQRGTGFTKLRLAKEGIITSDFCVAAAEKMMELEGVDRASIDGLIMVTQYPDYVRPTTTHVMQQRLKLSNDIAAIDLIQGCAGYVYGLYEAALLVSSGSAKRVLLCVGDSAGIDNVDGAEKNTSVLFGAGGAVTIVEAGDDDIAFGFKVYGERHHMLIAKHSGYRMPPADIEELFQSHMDGSGIMDFSLNDVPRDLANFLKKCGLTADETDLFAVHQANRMIVRSLASLMGVPFDKIPFTAGEIGNLSSASIPVLLADLPDDTKLAHTCLCGYGIGLSVGCAMVDFSHTHMLGHIEL